MRRSVKAALSGLVVGSVCIGLVALPNAFNPHDGQFNNRLKLIWFLGLSMPGLVMSLVLGLWARRRLEPHAVLITWCSAVVLAVTLPAPAILSGTWADGLICWYIPAAVVIGALWGWTCQPTHDMTRAQQAGGPA